MKKLIDYLRGCPEGFNTRCGLCYNIAQFNKINSNKYITSNKYVFEKMREVARNWKHFSGDTNYPIDGGRAKYLATQAIDRGGMYKGTYGRRRIELANLIADELERQLCQSNMKK
ncbi:hypothetical protein S0112_021 [Shewanella phage S0112]|nr:hypothetical protein S0112_021 [Shewanella phage S0112]